MSDFTPEAITLAVYDKNASEYGVCWQTEKEGQPVLQYTDANDEDFSDAVTVSGECLEGMGTVKNVAVIKGLNPGDVCRWRVGDKKAGEYSAAMTFRAIDSRTDSLGFYIMTDTQDGNNLGEWWKAAWRDAKENFPDAGFFIHAGDIVQLSGNRMFWREMLSRNEEFVRGLPTLPVAGNHDYWECYLDGYKGTFNKHYHIDIPNQDTWTGIYYSCDIGPCHFTMLNSGDNVAGVGSGLSPWQLEWMKNDISSSDKKWKIVVIHNPLYSPGKYGSAQSTNYPARVMRGQLDEVLHSLGVDLVISGHDHMYSKSFPVKADGEPQTDYKYEIKRVFGEITKVSLSPDGPIHIIAGCAGNQDRKIIDGIGEEYLRYFDDMLDTEYGHVGYSYVKASGDSLDYIYRLISVETGKCAGEKTFSIRK